MNKIEKPLGYRAYGSIPHLPGSRTGPADIHVNEGQARIATIKTRDKKDVVIVQEKLDGSNVAIAKKDGKILALQRAGYLAKSSPFEQHHRFAAWVERQERMFEDMLFEEERICGEWLLQAHGTRYLLPHDFFVAFDYFSGKERSNYSDFLQICMTYEIDVPRLLHVGGAYSIEAALKSIKTSGHGAVDPVEGAVWRVEREGKVDFLCKYVRPDKKDGCFLPEFNDGKTFWNERTDLDYGSLLP